ncbi:hypothetical protein RGR602_PC01999 (plasmid) [Rhizobium gallicum bv. gallicum R602sp]|uniref:Uncharacterized protein n=1 Tax=Rhizobium gallicum bv. gallicum R602sp TaxID=1041138 RepID=A0A0B4XHX5_9HYPH|nr:hypothetical protein RGR602_PC01999 [Rhizobium gallicum bv. gallicum R602sp]
MPAPHRAATIHEDPSAVIGVDAGAIANAKIKTDKIDATVLALLLQADGAGSLGSEPRPEGYAARSVSGCFTCGCAAPSIRRSPAFLADCPQVPDIRILFPAAV